MRPGCRIKSSKLIYWVDLSQRYSRLQVPMNRHSWCDSPGKHSGGKLKTVSMERFDGGGVCGVDRGFFNPVYMFPFHLFFLFSRVYWGFHDPEHYSQLPMLLVAHQNETVKPCCWRHHTFGLHDIEKSNWAGISFLLASFHSTGRCYLSS